MSYTGLVERLREPDWHDPKCPFDDRCYCAANDGDPPPHDRWHHPDALEAADAIEALTRPVDVEAIVDAALDAANVVTLDGYFEYDREAALAAALAAMETPHADG